MCFRLISNQTNAFFKALTLTMQIEGLISLRGNSNYSAKTFHNTCHILTQVSFRLQKKIGQYRVKVRFDDKLKTKQ